MSKPSSNRIGRKATRKARMLQTLKWQRQNGEVAAEKPTGKCDTCGGWLYASRAHGCSAE